MIPLISVILFVAGINSQSFYGGIPVYGAQSNPFLRQQITPGQQLPFQSGMSPLMQNEMLMSRSQPRGMMYGGSDPMSQMPLNALGQPMTEPMPMQEPGFNVLSNPMLANYPDSFRRNNMYGPMRSANPFEFGGPRGGAGEVMHSYPGQYGDSGIMTAGNSLPSFPMSMAGRYPSDGFPGVSYFPFARIRPGPGLVIITGKEQEEGAEGSFAVNGTDATITNDTATGTNGTEADMTDMLSVSNTTELPAFPLLSTTTRGSTTHLPRTTTPELRTRNTTTSTSATKSSSPPPCTSPVYMSRVYMSTALAMGLISANTSCVVLLDH